MPRWFRVAFGGFFLVLFLGYFLVKDGVTDRVFARSLVDRAVGAIEPLRRLRGMTAFTAEPDGGAYTVNGMRVAFRTVPMPLSFRDALSGLDRDFRRAGYKTKIVDVAGRPALVGVHPKTKVLLTAQPRRDGRGRPVLRLTQQNLADVTKGFVAEIPGVPMLPGARAPLLVSAIEGPRSTTLTYSAEASPESAREFYVRGLEDRGWRRLVPPVEAPPQTLSTLFFRKDDEECTVLVAPGADPGASIVFVTVGAPAGEAHG